MTLPLAGWVVATGPLWFVIAVLLLFALFGR